MQIKAEKQDPAYSLASGYQAPPPPPLLTAQNGAPLQPPSHPSQLPTSAGQLPPRLQPMYSQPGYNQGAGQPPFYPTPSQQQTETNTTKPPEPEKPKISENQIDFSSVKGIFGWTTVDAINVPYIFRKDKKFVSVRVVEQKLLSRYPNSYPDELGKHQPLTSYFITGHESKLLNEINLVHCGGEFGQKQFNTKDLIVLLDDFVDFYNLVKKTFPENKQNMQSPPLQSMQMNTLQEEIDDPCGWIQVNNTVTPYVKRSKQGKFVPLSVMKYAAALSIPDKGVLPSDDECDLLNKACKLAGFNFTFSKTTRIICLTDIVKYCTVHLIELPMENPLQHAQYLELSPSPSSQTSTTPTSQPSQATVAGTKPAPTPPSPQVRPQSSEKVMEKQPTNVDFSSPSRFPPPPSSGMAPAYYDPRYMTNTFSYNRHPFMYPVQYGPPNVTVNQPHPAFPQMGRQPYLQNGQYPSGQIPGVRNPSQDSLKSRLSPARGIVNGNSAQKSPLNNRITPPQSMAGVRSHVPPTNQGNMNQMYQARYPQHMMPPGVVQGYNRPGSTNTTNTMTGQRPTGTRQSSPSNGQSFPFMPNYPMPSVGQSNFPHGRPPVGVVTSKQTAIPPPPHMSGPHQAGQAPQRMSQQQNVSNSFITSTPNQQYSSRYAVSHPSSAVQGQGSNSIQNKPTPIVPVTAPQHGGSKSSNQISSPPKHQESGKTAPPGLVDSIKGVWLSGKSISCMHLNSPGRKGKFCLVEAVCKLYFNGCSVNEFLYALENVLHVPLVTCTDEEEKSFIHYYSLPVTVLKCNKMIDYDDLKKFFPQLSYVFRDKTGSNSDNQKSPQNIQTEAMTNNNNNVQKDSDSNHTDIGKKRPSSGGSVGGPPSKQPCRRLEETVQRLMNQQGTTVNDNHDGERPQTKETGGAIIILD